MKALVTGANGFLGSNLVTHLLDRGYEVRTMTRRQNDMLMGLNVECFYGDIRSYDNVVEACKDQEIVFHCAAITGVWGPWRLYHGTNTIGTRNVVEACRECRVPKLVYTSSPSVTFDGDHQANINESVGYPRKWLCHYPHSKALAEQYVLNANEDKELMTCSLRPHLIWGPGDRHLIPRLLKRAKSKRLRRVGDGTNMVDTIFVDNASVAHIQAAEAMEPGSPVCGSAYYLSQDDPVNCWGWINEILTTAGLPRIRKSISYFWAYRLGYALETAYELANVKTEPPMTRFLAAQLAKSHYYDISRAKNDFGYYPTISNAEGMKRLEKTLISGVGSNVSSV